jgi:hypothetical protein
MHYYSLTNLGILSVGTNLEALVNYRLFICDLARILLQLDEARKLYPIGILTI